MKIVIYRYPASNRSEMIAQSMFAGIKSVGDDVIMREGISYREPEGDVAVFYGLLKDVLNGYRNAGKKAVYIDLGYWGRHEGGRRAGFHKVSVNSRHPTTYLQQVKHPSTRFDHFGVSVSPRRESKDGYIMLAGMSAKAANAEGLRAEEWERATITEIRKHTKREIVYRPKPNWHDSRPIEGTRYAKGADGDVHQYLDKCHAVISHHSNVSVDAVLYGVPTFCVDGVATLQSSGALSSIESPTLKSVEERRQFAYDLAYTQWSVAEMKEGLAWRYLKDEGLVL